ncbi:MAG: hypothetical protein U0930_16500 [Pirellulales bacterium]
MYWFNQQARQHRRVCKTFQRMGLRFDVISNYRFNWLVKFDQKLNVQCTIRGRYVLFVGDPDIGFVPRQFPTSFLAQLLIRNAEVPMGAWQLDEAGGRVWCNFGLSIPYTNFTIPIVKHSLELLLAETHRVALRYRQLGTI